MRSLILASLSVCAYLSGGIWYAHADDATWYMVIGSSGECRRFEADPLPMQEKLRNAGGSFTDPQTGGTITDRSEQPGVIERVISDGKGHTVGLVIVKGADACQATAVSMRDTHLMPFQQRAKQKAH